MGVTIHEPWRECGVPEINHLRVGWRGQIASRIHNLIALNNNHAITRECIRFSIEQTRRFQNDNFISALNGNCRAGENGKKNSKPRTKRRVHPGGIKTLRR
jgi:hypothetical protein